MRFFKNFLKIFYLSMNKNKKFKEEMLNLWNKEQNVPYSTNLKL